MRVVPNKFAALSPEAQPIRVIQRSRRTMGGFGVHDVIIDTPDHSQIMALLPEAHIANVLRVYKVALRCVEPGSADCPRDDFQEPWQPMPEPAWSIHTRS